MSTKIQGITQLHALLTLFSPFC